MILSVKMASLIGLVMSKMIHSQLYLLPLPRAKKFMRSAAQLAGIANLPSILQYHRSAAAVFFYFTLSGEQKELLFL